MNSKKVNSTQLGRGDHQYLWHPFTHMKEWEEQTPLIISKAQGVYVYDTDGHA